MPWLLPLWIGLCSPQTPFKVLNEPPDTVTWDLFWGSALTVNYSLRRGSVCEVVVLHWHRRGLITHRPKNGNAAAVGMFVVSVFYWTRLKPYKENMRILVHTAVQCPAAAKLRLGHKSFVDLCRVDTVNLHRSARNCYPLTLFLQHFNL